MLNVSKFFKWSRAHFLLLAWPCVIHPAAVREARAQTTPAQLTVNDGGADRSRIRQLVVDVPQGRLATAGSLQIQSLTTRTVLPQSAYQVTPGAAAGQTVITFTTLPGQALPDGNYVLSVLTHSDGASVPRQNEALSFHAYFGDQDGDRDVDFLDTAVFRKTLNLSSTQAGFDGRFDSDGDGTVNQTDTQRLQTNYFKILPQDAAILAYLSVDDGALDSDNLTSIVNVEGTVFRTPETAQAVLRGTVRRASDPSPDANAPYAGDLSADLTSPTGFTLNETRLQALNGAALEEGVSYRLYLQLVKPDNSTAALNSLAFTIAPGRGNSAPDLLTPGDRLIPPALAFSTTVFATDPDPGDTLTFSLVTGPPGMTVASSGKLDWTPAADSTGPHPVTVRVADAAGESDSGSFVITVAQPEQPLPDRSAPVLSVPANSTIVAGSAFAVTAGATDADAGDVLAFSLPAAPPGMSINASNGAITWTPATEHAGMNEITVKVTDSFGLADTGTFSVRVTLPNRAPVALNDIFFTPKGVATTIPIPGVLGNDSDPDGNPLTATLLSGVQNGTLNFRPDGTFDYRPGTGAAPIQARLAYGFHKFTVNGSTSDFKPNDTIRPVAADLDGDGKPEIITIGTKGAGIANAGWLLALKLDTATQTMQPLWSFHGISGAVSMWLAREPAVGDVNGDGKPEVVIGGECRGEILIFSNTGQLLVNTQADIMGTPECYVAGSNPAVQLADLDGDGAAEIIVQHHGNSLRVFNGRGEVLWERQATGVGVNNISAGPVVADIDLDGRPNIYYAGILFDAEGNTLWTLSDPRTRYGDEFVAVANLDEDPFGEIVIFAGRNPNSLRVVEHDGTCKWVAVNSSNPPTGSGCTPPLPFPNASGPLERALLVADVQGDGLPEIIAASAESSYNHVTVFRRDGTILWQKRASIGGTEMGQIDVAAFDFNGDGVMEVVVSGRHGTIFLSGADGSTEFEIPWDQFNPGRPAAAPELSPIVVDMENDGHAELVIAGRDSSGGPTGFFVYKDVNDRWMPTRSVWNQARYQITNVNSDGTIPRREPVNWLTPGLNNYGVNVPAPDELRSTDSFTYQVSDGTLTSNAATVTLEIRKPNNPPVILSRPVTASVPGFNYRYHIFATDPDAGDAVTISLLDGPAGMAIDAGSVLRWTPAAADLGTHTVVIGAQDRDGATTVQSFTLNVIEAQPVPDVTGKPRADAVAALEAAGFAGGRITQEDHPSVPAGSVISQSPPGGASEPPGTAVALVVSAGPGPGNTDGDGDGFTPNQGDCSDTDPNIHPGAQDASGDGIDQDCDGVDGNLTLASIIVEPANPRVLTNRLVPLTATGVFTDGTSQNLTAVVTWSTGAPRFSSSTAGTFTVTATKGAISGTTEITVADRVTDTAAPQAEITSPASGTTITAPTDVLGSAADPNFLKYELAYAPAGTTDFTVITTGSNPVSNGVLGKFDPTTLINDLYTIRLTVYDRGGNESVAETSAQVDENMKVGNFSLTFTDLQIPLSGIPITISRNYDSRDKGRGDFGVGWRLGIQSLKLRSNRVPGTGWNVIKSGLAFGLQPSDVHIVGLTLPDGRVEVFEMVVSPQVSPLVPFPPSVLKARFVPRAGTLGRLESLENNTLSIFDTQPGTVELLDDITLATYNPQRFRYTAPDGTVVVIHAQNGVQSVTSPDGNTLTFTTGGIFHSSGKSVLFTRDSAGRIITVTDPAGGVQRYTYDGNGDLRTHTDAGGNVTRYDYNRSHGLLRVTDPLNRVVGRSDYDDTGRLIRITNANGRVINFTHDVNARREVVTDAGGQTTVMEYDERGNVLRTTDALGGVSTNTYDADGNQLTTTNPEGETITRTFDGRRNLLSQKNALGETTTFTYNGQDKVTSLTDPLGRVTRFEYTAAGKLQQSIDAAGNVSQRNDYDAKGNLIARTDARGFVTQFEYDASGNKTVEIDAKGARSTMQYNSRGDLVKETDRRGASLLTAVDSRGFFTQKTDPLGNVSRFTFNEVGVMSDVTDAMGNVTRQEVDATGKDLSITDATNYRRGKTYDIRGNATGTPNTAGQTLLHEYDELSRRVKTIAPGGAAQQQFYDKAGRVIRSVDARGNAILMEYDDAGRNTKITDALGHTTQFAYDAAANLIRKTDAKGNVFQFEYDALDRLIRTRFPDGTTTVTGYDAGGNVTSETDAAGHATLYSYDPNGRLQDVIDPLGGQTRFEYDADGNLLRQVDANGRATRFAYDANGRLIRKICPDGTTEAQTYDTGGRIASVTDAAGRVTLMEYDPAGRPLRKTFPDGTAESFTYSPAGQLISATNASGTVQFSYDADDRLLQVTNIDGSTITYGYDLTGNRTAVTTKLPGGPTRLTAYTYDRLNRIETVTDSAGAGTRYGYDEIGNLASVSYPNGVVSTYTYNALSRLVLLTHSRGAATLASYAYIVNAAGDRTRVTHADSSFVEYEYDARRRLIRESHMDPGGTKHAEWRYAYDAVGNRTSLLDPAGRETLYRYDAADKLLSAGPTGFAYDARGNIIARNSPAGSTAYAFNPENEMTGVNTPAGSAEFAYDARGERIRSNGPGGMVHYLVDTANATGVSQVLADYDTAGAALAEYTYGYELLGQRRNGAANFHHRDGSGNVRLLSDSAGDASDTYVYNAFGERLSRTGATANPYQFAGDRYGELEGLTFLRARYYDPSTGRFISKDPFEGVLRDPVSLHRYLYANANPVAFTDPTGLMSLAEVKVSASIGFTISLSVSLISGDSIFRAVPKAIIAAGFAVLGGGAVGAIGVKMATLIAGSVARRALIGVAIIVSKAAVTTVLSLANWATDNWWDGAELVRGLSLRSAGHIFVINLMAEAVTFGLLPVGVSPASEADRVLAAGIDKRVWHDFIASGYSDFVNFLKAAKGGTARYDRAKNLIPELSELAEIARKEIITGFKMGLIVGQRAEAEFTKVLGIWQSSCDELFESYFQSKK
jgi:RHS repeat-associated protein